MSKPMKFASSQKLYLHDSSDKVIFEAMFRKKLFKVGGAVFETKEDEIQ